MTPTVILETIGLQVHPDFKLRRLAVRHTLLRYDTNRRWGGGGYHQTGYHFTAAYQHMSFPLITIWLLVFVITVSCDRQMTSAAAAGTFLQPPLGGSG